MTTKTKKSRKSAATLQQNCNTSATTLPQLCYKSVPLLRNLRGYLKKDVANLPQLWMPIETNLIFRYEFATLSPQTRYIFVAILLFCGSRGTDEIPIDITFLANALNVDARMLKKSLEELEISGLLLERKIEREEIDKTDRQTEDAARRVCVDDFNSFQNKGENQSKEGLLKKDSSAQSNGNSHRSNFSIEECLKYVEACQAKGEMIQSPKALANHLHKSGEADALIMATLYPVEEAELLKQQFGEPIKFTDSSCTVCFGAKMSDSGGKGYRACEHCRNERGKSTGFEPRGETNDANS